MLASRRVFTVIAGIIGIGLIISIILLATHDGQVQWNGTIPKSDNLASLPPQPNESSGYSSTIRNLPLDIDYTATRDMEETLAYLINPETTKTHYTATYREGSRSTDGDITSFLIDVESEKSTYLVQNNGIVGCASDKQQKETSWNCVNTAEEDH